MAYQNQAPNPQAAENKAVVVQQKYNFVQQMFEKHQTEITKALPAHMTADKVIRMALTEFRKNEKLQNCDPRSIFAAVIIASQLGLEIGMPGMAHLVPYGTECQLIPGYKGLVDLALRTGRVKDVYARCVYEHDEFDYECGTIEKVTHKPLLSGDRGKLYAVYAVAVFETGYLKYEVMTRSDVENVRKSSKGYRPGYDSPWTLHEAEMWKKTVIRRLCKTLPQSSELAKGLMLADAESRGTRQGLDISDIVQGEWMPANTYEGDEPIATDEAQHEQTPSEKAAAKARERINSTVGNKTATSAPVVEAEPADDDSNGLC